MMLRCWGYVLHEWKQVLLAFLLSLLLVVNENLNFSQGKGILLAALTSVLHMAQLSFPFPSR